MVVESVPYQRAKNVVVIELDSDEDSTALASAPQPNTSPELAVPRDTAKQSQPTNQELDLTRAAPSSPSSAQCTTPTITTGVTSDNHVTSTTQSPGMALNPTSNTEVRQ